MKKRISVADHKKCCDIATIAQMSLETLRRDYRNLLIDTCDDDTVIRSTARRVLTEFEVEGDSYGVPTPVDIVQELVEKIETLMKLKA